MVCHTTMSVNVVIFSLDTSITGSSVHSAKNSLEIPAMDVEQDPPHEVEDDTTTYKARDEPTFEHVANDNLVVSTIFSQEWQRAWKDIYCPIMRT